MIQFSENYTDTRSALKKASKARQQESLESPGDLKNNAWRFLYDIGFTKLNDIGPCTVNYGKSAKELVETAIDVVAEGPEARLYVMCAPHQDRTITIKRWIDKVKEIRKYDYDPSIKINKGYLLVTTSDVTDAERDKLSIAATSLD